MPFVAMRLKSQPTDFADVGLPAFSLFLSGLEIRT